MQSGAETPTPERGRSRWTSPWAVVAYVVVGGLVVVGSFWTARAGRADTGSSGPGPTSSASPGSGGTPRITISLTPTWESASSPAVTGSSTLEAEPAGMAAPVVLGGSAVSGYSRLDPATGQWLWRRDVQGRSFAGWAGSTGVFGGTAGEDDPPAAGIIGVAPDGDRVLSSQAGQYVASTTTRILLAQGRRLTALTPTGHVAWRATLPEGVTSPGHTTGPTGPDVVVAAPTVVAFTSTSGPGRVATVDLVDGGIRTQRVDAASPDAWSTAWGVLVADDEHAVVSRYDRSGSRVWSERNADLLAVQGTFALVSSPVESRVSLLRVQDGSTVWTSEPLEGPVMSGSLTMSTAGPVLVSLEFGNGSDEPPVVLAADPTSGEQLWAVQRRSLLGTWHGYGIFAETDGRALSALDLRTGISYATLNASVVVDPSAAVITGNTLVYLDPAAGTARAVALADRI